MMHRYTPEGLRESLSAHAYSRLQDAAYHVAWNRSFAMQQCREELYGCVTRGHFMGDLRRASDIDIDPTEVLTDDEIADVINALRDPNQLRFDWPCDDVTIDELGF